MAQAVGDILLFFDSGYRSQIAIDSGIKSAIASIYLNFISWIYCLLDPSDRLALPRTIIPFLNKWVRSSLSKFGHSCQKSQLTSLNLKIIYKAGNAIRTRDIHLGKVTLYH